MRKRVIFFTILLSVSCKSDRDKAIKAEVESLRNCAQMINSGIRPIATTRDQRFQGKVEDSTAVCRGGDLAAQFRATPWVDWSNYWGTGDAKSKAPEFVKQANHLGPTGRGIDGALLDLEYQRIELIKFNLFDNNKTYQQYVTGRKGVAGPALKFWAELRLPPTHPNYRDVGGAGDQVCRGELIRGRTLTGICNDIRNPLMGSTGTPFARNAEFDTLFPDLGRTELTRNRHGDRLALLKPDPQVISRKLFTRAQSNPGACNEGYGLPGFSKDANCDYKKAPFFNVLAAFWIQFMTHDWFSHLDEGHNAKEYMSVGCSEADQKLGCRPGDRIDKALVAESERARQVHARRQGVSGARAEDLRQQRDRVVGRLADLRLRRALAQAREARSGGPRTPPHAQRPAAGLRTGRPDQPRVGRPGSHGVSRITGPSA